LEWTALDNKCMGWFNPQVLGHLPYPDCDLILTWSNYYLVPRPGQACISLYSIIVSSISMVKIMNRERLNKTTVFRDEGNDKVKNTWEWEPYWLVTAPWRQWISDIAFFTWKIQFANGAETENHWPLTIESVSGLLLERWAEPSNQTQSKGIPSLTKSNGYSYGFPLAS